jgi:hypothetical protein
MEKLHSKQNYMAKRWVFRITHFQAPIMFILPALDFLTKLSIHFFPLSAYNTPNSDKPKPKRLQNLSTRIYPAGTDQHEFLNAFSVKLRRRIRVIRVCAKRHGNPREPKFLPTCAPWHRPPHSPRSVAEWEGRCAAQRRQKTRISLVRY